MTLDKKKIESDMKIKLNKLKILVNEKSGSEKRVINREIRFIEALIIEWLKIEYKNKSGGNT